VIVVGQPGSSAAVQELVDAGVTWVETENVRDALNVISSAKLVVSVDTGLMHLALNQQVPVVAIWVDQPGSFHFMRNDEHCFSLLSARCRPECVRGALDMKLNEIVDFKEWQQMFVWDCPFPETERCMSSITVDTVWQKTRQALQLSARRVGRAPVTGIGGHDN
jgi:ADP-heptose:LPS heptosyltransferase